MDKITERIVNMEKQAEYLEHRIKNVEKNHEALQELKTTVELLAHTNENQNKQIENQSKQFHMISKSMESINENLTNLNHSHSKLHDEIGRVNDRVEKIEDVHEDTKIDTKVLWKNFIVTTLTTISALILGYLTIGG